MRLLISRLSLCSILFVTSFVFGCGQEETNKLVHEINAERAKSQALLKQAETKRVDAAEKSGGERGKLIEEAADLYGQISKLLNQSADKAEQIVKLNNAEWYREYFSLQSKYYRNLATSAANAQQELLVRNRGEVGEAQLKSWKEDISRLTKENDQLRKRIAEIEAEHGTTLRKP